MERDPVRARGTSMRRTHSLARLAVGATVAVTAVAGTTLATAGQASGQPDGTAAPPAASGAATSTTYLVMFAQGTDGSAAVAAAESAGAAVVSIDRKLGYAVVRTNDSTFAAKVAGKKGVQGAARDRVIGQAPKDRRDAV